MCARYTTTLRLKRLLDAFLLESSKTDYQPRYNIAPTQTVPVIYDTEPECLDEARWGLIPSWAQDVKIGAKMVNARAETLAEKPSFRTLLHTRRCLIPADGYYEWFVDTDGKKTPVRFVMKDDSPFAFAGLWSKWRDEKEETVRTCAIITTDANELAAKVHHRMPVILDRAKGQRWLSITDREEGNWKDLLLPCPADRMRSYTVSRKVNISRVDMPELVLEDKMPKGKQPSNELPDLFDSL